MAITFTAERFDQLPRKDELPCKYSKICKWAQKRYTKNNMLVVSVGGKPSIYSLIEQMSWNKYMLGNKN
jgi:hypothetical protein